MVILKPCLLSLYNQCISTAFRFITGRVWSSVPSKNGVQCVASAGRQVYLLGDIQILGQNKNSEITIEGNLM